MLGEKTFSLPDSHLANQGVRYLLLPFLIGADILLWDNQLMEYKTVSRPGVSGSLPIKQNQKKNHSFLSRGTNLYGGHIPGRWE